jgi:hypothetical protein
MIPQKTTLGILRDCLKVVPFMTGSNNRTKNAAIRAMIMSEFRKNIELTDATEIEQKRMIAIKGISNYYVHTVKEMYLKQKEQEENESEFESTEESD